MALLSFGEELGERPQTGLNQLEDVVGKRTKAIERKLKDVQVLSVDETNAILPIANGETVAEEEE